MDLLDYMAQILGYLYLSDLRYHKISKEQARKIEAIEGFTLAQFCEAANYLLKEERQYETIEQAKHAIIKGLLESA